MPKCPYCSEELRLRLTIEPVSEIDPNYYKVYEAFIEQMPRILRGMAKSQMKRIQEYPPFVQVLVCSYCDTVINASIQSASSNTH